MGLYLHAGLLNADTAVIAKANREFGPGGIACIRFESENSVGWP